MREPHCYFPACVLITIHSSLTDMRMNRQTSEVAQLCCVFSAWFLLAWKDRFFEALKFRFTSR